MSILNKTAIALVIILTTASCKKDFLDLTPNTYLNGATYFQNSDEVLSAVNGVYPLYRSQLDIYMQMTEMRSDNTTNQYNPSLRAFPSTHREELDEFRDNSGNQYTNYWNIAYSAIYRANTILSRIEAVPFSNANLKSRSIGECLFARAFFYFNLVRFYGDVPLLTAPVTDVSTSFSILRSPATEVYEQIEKDAVEAAALLPQSYTGVDVGRVTKGAALTLLAKLQMTNKDFTAAVSTLRQIQGLGYALQPKYQDIFKPTNKNNSESIFEIQYSSSIANQSNNTVLAWVPYRAEAWMAIFGYAGGTEYGYNLPTKDLISAYEAGDERKDVSIKTGYTTASGTFVPIPYINKWIYPDPVPFRNNTNFPVYRYADVLLMLAEAINETAGPTSEAVGLLNQIRDRAGLDDLSPASADQMRLALEQERRIELAFEGHRWFDLLRTGRAVAVMTAHGVKEKADPTTPRNTGEQYLPSAFTIETYRLLYPVPLSEITKNPSRLTQNAGY